MLLVLSGLPGTGKTTLAKALAVKRSAYVRADEIEHALTHHTELGPNIGAAGYVVAFAVAASNLRDGTFVIATQRQPGAKEPTGLAGRGQSGGGALYRD